MPKTHFKTESKKLLDMMINSVYTHKEIFLRELISNASDAIDKLYFRSLTDDSVSVAREDFKIVLKTDKEARILTITDNGCGMTHSELSENLGTIAHSGTLEFREGGGAEMETIGQFGVGFYSAFMVARRVEVRTRSYGAETGYLWVSEGVDGYTITEDSDTAYGTSVRLYLKENAEDENYDEFLEDYKLKSLIRKHSDFIRYPIILEAQQDNTGDVEKDETPDEYKPLNSMTPVWRKPKSELEEGQLTAFYRDTFHDMSDPAATAHYEVEGAVTFTALIYIPVTAPYNYYTKEFERGLSIYSNGVLIMEKCAELLPEYFGFARGLIDSSDLTLNISRETLQHNRQLKVIARNVEKKIASELKKLLTDNREKYEEFYKSFGMQLKYGLYQGFGANRETLEDLVLFHSIKQEKLITFSEYIEHMGEEQKYIYYVSAETPAKAGLLPQTGAVLEKGCDILVLTDDVDEFSIKMLMQYKEKEFRSVSGDELDLSDEEKQNQERLSGENRELLDAIKAALGDEVSGVVISARLTKHPVCLTTEGELSIEMERVLAALPQSGGVKAKRVLELNANHEVFAALKSLHGTDNEKLALYSRVLYAQAQLIEGLKLDDPVAYSNDVCALMG